MRTTLTIDDDVAFGIKRFQEQHPDLSLKRAINELLRKGLDTKPNGTEKKRFKVRSFPIGLRDDLNFDNIEEVLDQLEGVHRR